MTALPHIRRLLLGALFLIGVPAVFHGLFSPLGFNPTDDGFTLAYSRRLLDGQVPHRDFILIRPCLSPLMHVPVVRFGGDATFLWSRFVVWVELAAIAWAWLHVAERLLGLRLSALSRFALALLALMASAHTFPIMAWHTIDGLLLTVLGMAWAVAPPGSRAKPAGYLLMGLAVLCKQSFLPAPFLVLLLLGDVRRPACIVAILLPGLAYAAYLATHGALRDGLVQLTSHADLIGVGVASYLRVVVLAGLLLGFLWAWALARSRAGRRPFAGGSPRWSGALAAAPALSAALALPPGHAAAAAYALFGATLACALTWLADRVANAGRLRLAALALIAAWSASLSIGYHVPTLGAGAMLLMLLTLTLAPVADSIATPDRTRALWLPALAMVALACFGVARTRHVYRDAAAVGLEHSLDGVLPGGRGIRTNLNTYLFLADLREAERRAARLGDAYTMVPGCAACWVRSSQRNALSIDWAQGTELAKPELVDRVAADLELRRGRVVVIVPKAEAEALVTGFTPLRDRYAMVRYVRRELQKVGETELFELYR